LDGTLGALPHGQKRTHAELFEVDLFQNLDLDAVIDEVLQTLGEIRGRQHVGGFVHQVAGEEHAHQPAARDRPRPPPPRRVW
jgi:hypothetical protein